MIEYYEEGDSLLFSLKDMRIVATIERFLDDNLVKIKIDNERHLQRIGHGGLQIHYFEFYSVINSYQRTYRWHSTPDSTTLNVFGRFAYGPELSFLVEPGDCLFF